MRVSIFGRRPAGCRSGACCWISPAASRRAAGPQLCRRRAHCGEALAILCRHLPTANRAKAFCSPATPATTRRSAGSNMSDERVREKCPCRACGRLPRVQAEGWDRRTPSATCAARRMLREIAGPDCRLMFDANQQWTLREADTCARRCPPSTHTGSKSPRIPMTSKRTARWRAPSRPYASRLENTCRTACCSKTSSKPARSISYKPIARAWRAFRSFSQ